MSGDRLEFDFDEARRSEARIRAYAEEVESVFKNLRNQVDESSMWWAGPSHEAFASLAYDFLAQKHSVLNVIRLLADGMEKAVVEKNKDEEETCAFISSHAYE